MRNIYYKFSLYAVAIIVIAFNLTTSANAASAGALDATFDSDGKVTTNLGSEIAFPRDMIVQPDGKIIVVSGEIRFAVIRYNANGTLDTTFDGDGIRSGTLGGTSNEMSAVDLQSDGKIIIAGSIIQSGIRNFAVARLNRNGSFDTSFGTGGIVITDFNGTHDFLNALKVQVDGKIIVGGYTGNDFAFVRYNSDGTLDTTFDTDGKVTVNFGGTDQLNDIAIQADGKIIGAGVTSVNNDYALCRLNTDGSLDTTFGVLGRVTTDILGSDTINSVVILPDGRILAAGSSSGFSRQSIVKYFSNGSPDTSFDGDGKVLTSFSILGNTQGIREIKTQSDGKIVAIISALLSDGSFDYGGLFTVRYNANGSLDTSFGNNGFVMIRVQQTLRELPGAIEILNGGKALIAGATFTNSFLSLAQINLNITPTQSGDFDGDGFTDVAVFRPSTANWFILRSSDNTTQISGFGANGDIPLDGDFDGDGRNDLAIYRPTLGQWWFQRSSDNTVFATQFGLGTDKPVPGDYDKDGKTDIAIFRPSTGEWLILRSSSNNTSFYGFPFGGNGDIPITQQGF